MNDFSIPSEWVLIKLGEISEIKGGKRLPKGKELTFEKTPFPYIRVTDFENATINCDNLKYLDEETQKSIKSYTISKDDLYISIAGTIGLVGEVPKILDGANLTENAAKICEINHVDKNFLKFYLNSLFAINQFDDKMTSSGQPKLALFRIRDCLIPLPPKAEQKKIAELLDSHLMQVENIKARLSAIIPILKKFRQSILADAVSGRLIDSKSEKQTKQLDKIANILDPHPSHRTPKEVLDGVPYIGIGDLKSDGTIDFGNSRKVSEEVLDEHKKRYKIQEGDFIFGKIGTLGKPTLLPTDLDYTLSANVILIQPNRDIVKADYLRLTLTAPQIIKEITDKSTATSQLAFGIKKMRNFEIQLPPIQEQREIIERVKQLFAFADNIETLINNALQRVNHLTKSILYQAFTGQLTADWRAKHPELITGDNSAEILLAKIQTAKEANQKPKSTKNQAKKEKTKMVSKLKKRSNFIYANTPLEEIPLHYRGYVKAHRHFESVVAKYEPKIAEFEDAKLFQEWIGWIRSDIKEVEKMIAQVEAEEMDFGTFKDYRYDLANGQFQGSLDGFYNSDESEIAEQAFDEIRKAGYIVYDYWIDSRQATDKLD